MKKNPQTSDKARSIGGYRKHLKPFGKRVANKATRRLMREDCEYTTLDCVAIDGCKSTTEVFRP